MAAFVDRMSLRQPLPWIAGVAAALLTGALVWSAIYITEDKSRIAYAARTQEVLVQVRDGLDRELQSALVVPEMVAAFIAVQGELDKQVFSAVVSRLVDSNRHIRNVALAPDNVISVVYPLAGNEQAVGLRFMDTPSRRDAVVRAIETRKTVVAGPIKLVQGGLGIASRTPVFRTPGDGTNAFWGIVSLTVNVESLFGEVIPSEYRQRFDIAVRGTDGRGARGQTFIGTEDVFAHDPVTVDYPLPGGGTWQLGATPKGGWETVGHAPKLVSLLAYLLAAVVGVLSYWLVVSRQHILDLATHDRLTGLINRRLFDERLSQAMAAACRHRRTGALLLIDLDGFKQVNDQYGHRAGDVVLAHVAKRIGSLIRTSDSAARFGGDEFALILSEVKAPDDALAIGRRVVEVVSEPIDLGQGASGRVGASVGVAVFSDAEDTQAALFERADRALYRSKREGKGRVSAEVDSAA